MPRIIDRHGSVVHSCKSDAEAVRWWKLHGEVGDKLEDTEEPMCCLTRQLELDED